MMEAEITEDVKQPTSNIASPNLKSAEMSEKYVFFFFDRYPTIYPSPPIRSSWLFYCQEMRARETSTGCRLSPKKASLSFLSPHLLSNTLPAGFCCLILGTLGRLDSG